MSNLPISPVTGKPSSLTAMIRRSTGIPDGAPSTAQAQPQAGPEHVMRQKLASGVYPVETPRLRAQIRRGMGLDQPQQQPQQTQQAQTQKAGVTADEIGAAVGEAVGRLLTPVLRQLERTVAQADAQTQQAMVQQADYETPISLVTRSAVQPGVSQTLPLPPTGGNPPAQTVAVNVGATSVAGYANAMVCQMQSGPMPAPVVRAYRKPGTVSVREAVRRSMGLPT